MKPLISVIIPTYNYGRFVASAIRSVQGQSCPDWECLVIDDGSTDDTKQVVEHISAGDPRVRYFHQENKGLSAARNRGIRESGGEFLQFLDADDLIESGKLEAQTKFLAGHPEADIVYGDMRYFAADKPRERLFSAYGRNEPWMPGISGHGKAVLKQLIFDNIMVVSSPLVRRSVVDRCGLFDETLKKHEDWEYWLRCALHGISFSYLDMPETLTLIQYHADSMSRNRIAMFRSKLAIHGRLAPKLPGIELKCRNYKEMIRLLLLIALERAKQAL